eukprot:6135424-Pyramimonas_sp.AAC.1
MVLGPRGLGVWTLWGLVPGVVSWEEVLGAVSWRVPRTSTFWVLGPRHDGVVTKIRTGGFSLCSARGALAGPQDRQKTIQAGSRI